MTQKITVNPFDADNYLTTSADVDSYLKAAFADGDPKVIVRALGDVARAQNMTKLARAARVHRVHLYRALSIDGDPKLSTLSSIMSALGYRLSFRREGVAQPLLKLSEKAKAR